MHREKPELQFYLAEETLKRMFSTKVKNLRRLREMQQDCRDFLSEENARFIYARMIKYEFNLLLAEAAVESLPEEQKKYVTTKYKDHKKTVAISLAMGVSVAQLNHWNKEILLKVTQFMQYRLSAGDIFLRDKIISMLELLRKELSFWQNFDPNHKIVTTERIVFLTDKEKRYNNLLCEIDGILQNQAESTYYLVVATKISNPLEGIRNIAAMCHADKGLVTRYLNRFTDSVRQYVE